MTEREAILGRVREALRASGVDTHGKPGRQGAPTMADYARVLPRVGTTLEERLAAFAAESKELGTEFQVVEGIDQASAALRDLGRAAGWKQVGSHHGVLTDVVVPELGLAVAWVEDRLGAGVVEGCGAGITECDCLVAQTGTVVVTSRSAGGRALSVLPPHHVVLARKEQVVGGLPEAFEVLEARYGPDAPSMISFITGPSRTGDIERILVLGAHGPKRLTVCCF